MKAGLGVSVGPASMSLPGMTRLDENCGLPPVADAEYVLVEPSPSATPAVHAFASVLRHAAALSFRQTEVDAENGDQAES